MTTTTSVPPSAPPPRTDRLTRPRHGRMIAGVCAGIAERYGWSPTTVRVIAVLSCLLPGPQFLVYLLLWVAMPARAE
jgi:phage shock protein PspC (stress-responsive transcriptional regulator)